MNQKESELNRKDVSKELAADRHDYTGPLTRQSTYRGGLAEPPSAVKSQFKMVCRGSKRSTDQATNGDIVTNSLAEDNWMTIPEHLADKLAALVTIPLRIVLFIALMAMISVFRIFWRLLSWSVIALTPLAIHWAPKLATKFAPPLAKCMVCVVTTFALTGLLPGVVFCKVVGMICNYYLEGHNRQAFISADGYPPQMTEFEDDLDEDSVLIEDVPDTDPDFIQQFYSQWRPTIHQKLSDDEISTEVKDHQSQHDFIEEESYKKETSYHEEDHHGQAADNLEPVDVADISLRESYPRVYKVSDWLDSIKDRTPQLADRALVNHSDDIEEEESRVYWIQDSSDSETNEEVTHSPYYRYEDSIMPFDIQEGQAKGVYNYDAADIDAPLLRPDDMEFDSYSYYTMSERPSTTVDNDSPNAVDGEDSDDVIQHLRRLIDKYKRRWD